MAKKILLVEDDIYIQDMYAIALKGSGYEVDVEQDGQAAIEKASKEKYDLILLDIMLPGKTGIDVLRALRENNSPAKDTPIVMMTNLTHDETIKEAYKLGANGYALKVQIKPSGLVKKVDAFFQGHSEFDTVVNT